MNRGRNTCAALAAIALMLSACGSDSGESEPVADDTEVSTTEAAEGDGDEASTDEPDDTTDDDAMDEDAMDEDAIDEDSDEAVTETTEADLSADDSSDGADAEAPAEGDPIRIGWVQLEEGAEAVPGVTRGADVAVARYNDAGGMNGRPIELVKCKVGTDDESNQACGQELADDDSLVAVVTGALTNAGPLYGPLVEAGVPVFAGVPVTPADFATAGVYTYDSGIPGVVPGAIALAVMQLGEELTSVAVPYANSPGGQAALDQLRPTLEATGVEITDVPLDPNATDVSSALIAANVESADAVLLFVGARQCIQVATAMKQLALTTPVFTIAECTSSSVRGSDESAIEGWYFSDHTVNGFVAPGSHPQIDEFYDAMEMYSDGDYGAGEPVYGYHSISTALEVIGSVDDPSDAEALKAAQEAFTGPTVLGSPSVSCPIIPDLPSLCTLSTFLYRIEDGVAVDQLGGEMFDPLTAEG